MGLLDLGQTPYQPKPVNLDGDTNALIDQSAKEATTPAADLAKQSMAGTEDSQNFLPSNVKGVGNVAMSGALTNKYQRLAGEDLSQLSRQQNYLATQRRADRLKQSAIMANARQQVAIQNYHRMVTAYNNEVAARAQVLSSILGLGGMVAGAAIGGPAGAMIGVGSAQVVSGSSGNLPGVGQVNRNSFQGEGMQPADNYSGMQA